MASLSEGKKKSFTLNIKKNILFFCIGIIAIILALIFDKSVSLFIFGLRNPVLDAVMLGVEAVSAYALIIIPTIFIFISDRKMLIRYWFSFALTLFVMILIKLVIHRDRPFTALDLAIPVSLIKVSYSTWDFSFPSNHSALSFTGIPFLKNKYLIIWIVIAAVIMFSRLYFGFHYLSDLLTGMMLGILIPIIVKKYIK
jgi:undecaprenyl-diphosphatase